LNKQSLGKKYKGDRLWQIECALERIAPLQYAAGWDQVGLLIEPAPRPKVRRVLLTIDLTESVLEEAIASKAELIVAYHPLIFAPLKRLRTTVLADHVQRVAVRAVQARIAVYSPHTALDAAHGGVNDWLAQGCGESECFAWGSDPRMPVRGAPASQDEVGPARLVYLKHALTLEALVKRFKRHLGLRHLRVAAPTELWNGDKLIDEVGICAGAGGSLFEGTLFQAYLTGEMRHHDVLAKVQHGSAIILCDHTNTERGYLPTLRQRLIEECPFPLEVIIAEQDYEPLRVV